MFRPFVASTVSRGTQLEGANRLLDQLLPHVNQHEIHGPPPCPGLLNLSAFARTLVSAFEYDTTNNRFTVANPRPASYQFPRQWSLPIPHGKTA
jgi:hypothetical protein